MRYTVSEIAEGMGATILCGDPAKSVCAWSFSSKEGDADTMFVPMKGERVDAHDFIADAYARGMRVTTTERGEIVPGTEGMTYLAVDNARDAWQRLGTYWRRRHESVPMAAITGSVGKTTTKELVALALAPAGKILKTFGNRNGQLGVPQMMAELEDDDAAAVIEMGMSMPGEMGRIADVAMPDIALITNIGLSHIGNLGSQEAIRREKLSIVNRLHEGGRLLVNGDDPLLAAVCPDSPGFAGLEEICMYETTSLRMKSLRAEAYGTAPWCRYRCEDIELTEETAEFTCVTPSGSVRVALPVTGMHNVMNATAAIAVAEILGVSAADAAESLRGYTPMAMRGVREILDGNILLIDDTYNASPDSMKSGLSVLCAAEGRRHIAMLADILELGDHSASAHRQVGRYVAERPVDVLITVGTEAEAIAAEVRESGARCEVYTASTKEEGQTILLSLLRDGDAVLLKGSRGMGLDAVAKALRER
ncbi:MAG: UDP-N-acetylmuramoyl-tripeptide--D-alanyl-D-alanine ligase [Lachnospiraceae bacterium]|nr:UDP-N-acetylmuramoyl-tripeptide--D-alanyl-D-alanine ligase [Lachnospiraceae bacterium]